MTSDTSDLIRSMEAERAEAQSHALDLALTVLTLAEQMKPLEAARKRAQDELKQWLALNGESLVDGERGIIARLQERKGTPTYDMIRAVESVEGCEALVAAATAGMVRIDHVMLARFRKDAGAGWADLLARFEMASTGSVALIVERKDK